MDDDAQSLPATPLDRDHFIRTVIGEAGPDHSALAVAHVIANRMRQTGAPAYDVVHAPNQFEAWDRQNLAKYKPSDPAYQRAAAIVDGVLGGKSTDPTQGALNFYAPVAQAALGRAPPKWGTGKGQTLGAQKFIGGADDVDPFEDVQASRQATPPAKGARIPSSAAPSADVDPFEDVGLKAASEPTATPPAPAASVKRPAENINVLANEPGETEASALAKGAATTAIKGASHIPGMMGDIANLSDYLMARARSAYTGEPVDQVMARHNALLQSAATGGGTMAPLASSYLQARAAVPSGQDISGKVFGVTGEYQPTSDIGRGLMGAGEIATTAGLAGFPIIPATVAGTAGNAIAEQTGEPLYGLAAALAIPGAAAVGRNALSNLAGTVRPNVANLADIAQNRFGIPIQPGQLSETPSVRMAHSFLNRLPMSGAGESIADQRASWQRALSHTIGEDSPVLDEDTMQAAKSRNGQTIEDVGRRTTIQADPQLQNGLVDTLIGARNAGLADHEIRPLESIFNQVVDNIDNNGEIAGEKYINMTKYKTQLWNAQHSPNPNIKEWAGNMREVLDDALERHATPEDRADLSQARYQYRNMKILEDVIDPVGDVSPGRLWSKVNQKMGNAPKYGRGGDLADLARISNRFVQEMPTSRTGENLTTMGALTSPFRYGAGFLGGRLLGNALLRNPEISGDIINRSLGRPVAGQPLLQSLARIASPYALQAGSTNALAAP